jgi:O-methyltransferase
VRLAGQYYGENMKKTITTIIQPLIQRFGIAGYPPDFDEQNIEICRVVKPYTMTSPEKVNALIDAVRYVVAKNINGAMVECGVWKGGSMMAMALTLKKLGDENRDLYLYDTFCGMTAPSDADGTRAHQKFSKTKISKDASDWCLSPLDEVKDNLLSTGYPKEKIHLIKGKVEDTIPENIPSKISLLRLDTDWYESTKHELTYLFPLLQLNGVLIIDDYGCWEGARKAVDEYISDMNIPILLNRIDKSGRIAIKT